MFVGQEQMALLSAPAALTAMGFTTAGVTAGSVAAATQSAVYGRYLASGSEFALAQSAGGAAGIDLIHDTHHLCMRLRIGGILAMSRGFSGGKQ